LKTAAFARTPRTGRQDGMPAPWWGQFVRARVGMRHHPLADLLNAFAAAGLLIEHATELGDKQVPTILGIRARKPHRGSRHDERALWIPASTAHTVSPTTASPRAHPCGNPAANAVPTRRLSDT
jgi:hypothetical protein